MIVHQKVNNWNSRHRAVDTIIATLLLVAISVAAGTILFVFSQGFFNQAQISGTPVIELVRIIGYDARDVTNLVAHDGLLMTVAGSDVNVQGKNVGEYVVVYVQNDSSEQVIFSEIKLGGAVYTYVFPGLILDFTVGSGGTYAVMDSSTHTILDQAGVAQSGETIGILFDLNDNFPAGRDIQFQLKTTNGAIFVGTVVIGQNKG